MRSSSPALYCSSNLTAISARPLFTTTCASSISLICCTACAIFSASWPACAGVIVSVVAAGEGSAVASAVAIGEWVGAAVVAIGDAVGAVLTVLAEQPTIITLTAAMHISVKNHFFT